MDVKFGDSSFVVITGHPQKDKQKRISHVRSVIRKSRLRRENQYQQRRQTQTATSIVLNGSSVGSPTTRQLKQTIDLSWLSVSNAIRGRLTSFFRQYFETGAYIRPLFCSMLPVVVVNVPFMSTKLVIASAWDDLNGPNHDISALTLSQRRISENILSDSTAEIRKSTSSIYTDVTIIALLGLLSFEVVNGDRAAYMRTKESIYRLVDMRGGIDKLGFNGSLKISLLVMDRLEKVIEGFHDPADVSRLLMFWQDDNRSNCSLSQPSDFRLFTLQRGQKGLWQSEVNLSTIRLLSDFYQLVVLSLRYHQSSAYRFVQAREPNQQEILTRWQFLRYNLISLKSIPFHTNSDSFDGVLLHAILLFASPNDHDHVQGQKDYVQESVYELRSLLSQSKLDIYQSPLPGALVWCLIVGARRSLSGSVHRKWFMMQLIRIAAPLALHDDSVEVINSLNLILAGLDAVETVFEERESLCLAGTPV